MILHLHGFASAGEGTKAQLLRQAFPDEPVISPTLNSDPEQAVETIKSYCCQCPSNNPPLIVGISLGGFYALVTNALYGYPAVVINPSLEPHYSLRQQLGKNVNLATGETFCLTERHLQCLETYTKYLSRMSVDRIMLIVALDDQVLPPQAAISRFRQAYAIVPFEKAGHRFEPFEEVIPMIKTFREHCQISQQNHCPNTNKERSWHGVQLGPLPAEG